MAHSLRQSFNLHEMINANGIEEFIVVVPSKSTNLYGIADLKLKGQNSWNNFQFENQQTTRTHTIHNTAHITAPS